MAKKQEILSNYWSVYRAMNFGRMSNTREFIDKDSGKKMTYNFIGEEIMRNSIFLGVFSGIMWMSFPFLVILLSGIYFYSNPFSFLIGALAIVAYHFAAMYFVIRGPHIEITEVKKKGFFG